MPIDERQGRVREDVGDVAARWHGLAVVLERRVEVAVPVPAAEPEELVESLTERMVGILLAVVPLAEAAGRVAPLAKDLGERDFVGPHHFVPLRDARHPGPHVIAAGQERRPRRRTDGRDVKPFEPHARIVQRIEHRRVDLLVAVSSEVSPALIVRDDQQHVGWRIVGTGCLRHADGKQDQQQRGRKMTHRKLQEGGAGAGSG